MAPLNQQTLFIRTPRGMELTQAGELFLEEARNKLRAMNREGSDDDS